tara:strand:+ start:956 stop:1927 length:972 start_codon:yes stop_codon:yes gene_type:complete
MKDLKQTELFQTLSVEDSLAKTSQSQEKEKESKPSVQDCGRRCFDSFEMYGQRGPLLKMYLPCDLKDLPWSFKISARSGICLNGIVYPLLPLERITRGTGFGLWHTPTASGTSPAYEKRYPGGKTRKHPIPNLPAEVNEGIPYSVKSAQRKWATPTAMDSLPPKSQEKLDYEAEVPRKNRSKPGNLRDQVMVEAGQRTWPTPTTQENEHPNAEICPKTGRRVSKNKKSTYSLGLADAVQKWPTPTASDVEGGVAKDVQMENGNFFRENKKGERWGVKLRDAVNYSSLETPQAECQEEAPGGKLNPTWVEWLMGFPKGWTDLSA